MGNSPSSLSLAVAGLKDGDASDLSEESWAALLGSRERPPLTPAELRATLSDATLREVRRTRPWNLATVLSRAVERLEELIEPDEGKEHLGAAVAPHDAASLLSALRVLTRVLPFVVGCPAAPRSPSDAKEEDPATTAARAVHEHIWGAPSRVMKTNAAAASPATTADGGGAAADVYDADDADDAGGDKAEKDAVLLANALQWRKAESVGGDRALLEDYRDVNPRAAAAAQLANAAIDLAGGPPPLLNLGERILALVLDLLFCPGLTLAFVDPTFGGREWAAAGTEAPELATHRTEVTRLILALIASEGLHLPPGSSDPRPFLHLLATASTGVLTGHPVSHEDIFYALMGVVVSAAPESVCDGTPAGEQLAAALHCLLTLLDYEPPQTRPLQSAAAAAPAPAPASADADADGRRGGGFGSWFGGGGGGAGSEVTTTAAAAGGGSSSLSSFYSSGGGSGDASPISVLSNMYSRMLEGIPATSGNLEPLHQTLLKIIRSGLGGSGGSALSFVSMGMAGGGSSVGLCTRCNSVLTHIA
jgi:hypothetical protein